jgi:hypothetical protein
MRARGLWAILFGLVAMGVAAAAGARPPVGSGAMRVEKLIAEWRYEEAREELAALGRTHARDPHQIYLDGYLKFLLGDYASGLARLREAISLNRGADEWKALRDLVAATQRATAGFVSTESTHFVFAYAPGKEAVLVPYASEALEQAWRVLGEDLGYRPPTEHRIRIEIYSDIASLAQVSTLSEREIRASGTIALCKFNRLMIVSPRALERGYPWIDTLVHEFTHFIVSRASHNAVPIWLHEGLAKFEERRWRAGPGGGLSPSMEHLLATALRRGTLVTFAQMHPSLAKLPTQEQAALAFAEVYTVVEYLHGQKGYPGLRQLVFAMRDGADEPRALYASFGIGLEELQRAWRKYLRDLALKPRSGFVPQRLKFRRAGGKTHRRADDLADVPEERARRHARLGGLLRARSSGISVPSASSAAMSRCSRIGWDERTLRWAIRKGPSEPSSRRWRCTRSCRDRTRPPGLHT